MKKKICAGFLFGLAAAAAQAVPGEYWEVTTKMEMAGMPFAMPAVTMKLCVPKGGEKNPQHMQKKDSDCKMSDVRISGNKVAWKASCVHDGETLSGAGESYYEGDSYHGTLHLTGNSRGHDLDMTQTYNGRRVGGNCDSEAQLRELTGNLCDTSQFAKGTEWLARADMFLRGGTCPGKKQELCAAVRKSVAQDADTYQMLMNMEKTSSNLVVSSCGLRMEEAHAAVCRANREGHYEFLEANCPSEAKEYREQARRRNCEGRSYTSRELLDNCLSGGSARDDEAAARRESSTRGNLRKAREYANRPDDEGNASANNADAGAENAVSNSVLDSAKKLKGIFGF